MIYLRFKIQIYNLQYGSSGINYIDSIKASRCRSVRHRIGLTGLAFAIVERSAQAIVTLITNLST